MKHMTTRAFLRKDFMFHDEVFHNAIEYAIVANLVL